MKRFDLSQLVQVFANLAVLAGIVFLGFEVRQNSETMRIQASQINLNNAFQLDLRIATDDGLMDLLFSDVDERSVADAFQYERFATAVLAGWENSFYLNQQGVLSDELWEPQTRQLHDILSQQQDFYEFWQANRDYSSDSFNRFLDELLAD